ncbi:MAG: VCBS repeat-containing protein [Spirochaetaceae bacterium]|nr:VCBS repeat-containing protein [Myxococcales bacterium]MCB9722612.1 VCBS repeat-containing protein [Spirochaetaceae bacterium]
MAVLWHSSPCAAGRRGVRDTALVLGLLLLLGLAPRAARTEDSAAFGILEHRIPGRILQVWPLAVTSCADAARDLLVLSTDGVPPNARKWLTWMPCGSALEPGSDAILERALPEDVVILDVAALPGRVGPQLVVATATGLRIESLSGPPAPIRLPPPPGGFPLPPHPWGIGRLELVADWQGDGRPSLLVPVLDGAWLVDWPAGGARRLRMPVHASYRTQHPFLPALVSKWMIAEVTWPSIARVDDDGDGRTDLFALSRWEIGVHRAGPQGLPIEPTRRIPLAPFDEELERRHESTLQTHLALDVDGDARADLMLASLGGGLMDGQSRLRIHLGRGDGVSVDQPPDAVRERRGGFAGWSFADLDGDGRQELIETSVEFGIVQLVRVLLTRRVETMVRVFALDPTSEGGLRQRFEHGFAFALDFDRGVAGGVVPTLGDWNGDGIQDLSVAAGAGELSFRLGQASPDEPCFGRETGRQTIPLATGEGRAVDLDGDGLDEIVAFTDSDADEPLVVLHNRGRLPGTAPGLRDVPPAP